MEDQIAGEEPRNRDSIEQLDSARLPNPITGEDEALGEPGEAGEPDATNDDTLDQGPEPNIEQMPR